MTPIKIYYHTPAHAYWEDFYSYKIQRMKRSKLWDAASEIIICDPYDSDSLTQIKDHIGNDDRVRYVSFDDAVKPFGEQYTNRLIKQEAMADDESYYIFRLHNKGITRYNEPDWSVHKEWADNIDHHCIDKWQECVTKMDEGYDTVGINYYRHPWLHFSGNSWWATSEYIKKLPQLRMPHETGGVHQIPGRGTWTIHDAESWIGVANPLGFDLETESSEPIDHPNPIYR